MAVRVHLIIYGLVRVTPGTIVSGCRCRTAGAGGTCFLTAAILTLRLQTYAKKTIFAVLLNKNMYYSHNLGSAAAFCFLVSVPFRVSLLSRRNLSAAAAFVLSDDAAADVCLIRLACFSLLYSLSL